MEGAGMNPSTETTTAKKSSRKKASSKPRAPRKPSTPGYLVCGTWETNAIGRRVFMPTKLQPAALLTDIAKAKAWAKRPENVKALLQGEDVTRVYFIRELDGALVLSQRSQFVANEERIEVIPQPELFEKPSAVTE